MSTFSELRKIAQLLLQEGGEATARSEFIRFLDDHADDAPILPVLNALTIRLGLFPYLSHSLEAISESEALAVAYHSPSVFGARDFVFHSEQQQVYEKLLDGQNVILSAPTSFGKSAILDALILSERWANIVLIVPTVALIDETRRRLAGLESSHRVISHPAQSIGERNVFVLTQERFLELNPRPLVDFFVIDEFYKLGSTTGEDLRRSTLNIAWRELRSTGAQYYLLGPNVNGLDERLAEELRNSLFVSDFNTVVVDVEDRSSVDDPEQDVKKFLADEAEGPTLVFVSAPSRAAGLATRLINEDAPPLVKEVASWMQDNYDPSWDVAIALTGGVGVHTGPMPRSMQRAVIRLFEMRQIETLVCTTTLIEGVNTVARNVVVFDKKIDRKPIDFFTFSNIRGRAGRMLKHFVGRVITYAPPPLVEEATVDIPIDSQSENASLATLVQVEPSELTDRARVRLGEVLGQGALSIETIRLNRGMDPERQIEVADRLLDGSDLLHDISWSGAPTAAQLRSVLTLAYDQLLEPSQRRGMNVNIIMGKLQNIRASAGSVRAAVESQLPYAFPSQSRSDVVDDILSFQRNWMGFRIPSMLRAVSLIQNEIARRLGAPRANYEYAIREIEGLYLPPFIAELEDYGLPLPVGLKLSAMGLRGESIEEVVAALGNMARDAVVLQRLSRVERWFLSDVASGLAKELKV